MAEPNSIRRHPSYASPLDNDDLQSEILLRLPAQPSSLLRASLASKRWCSFISNPEFLRRFRVFHQTPPLLGFFHNTALGLTHRFVPIGNPPDRIPATRFSTPFQNDWNWRFLDCRHGRALLIYMGRREIHVWDPMAGRRRSAPLRSDIIHIGYGAVLCDHTPGSDCPSNPFHVVLVWRRHEAQHARRTFAAVYSSESCAWGKLISAESAFTHPNPKVTSERKPGTRVGNAIYWLLPQGYIIEFDQGRQSLAEIMVPMDENFLYWQSQLMRTDDGGLGLAVVSKQSIQVWKRATGLDGVAGPGWVRHKIVQLDSFLPPTSTMQAGQVYLLGFNEDSDVIFILTDAGIFMVQLDSNQSQMVCQGHNNQFSIYPYASFYTKAGKVDSNGNCLALHNQKPIIQDSEKIKKEVLAKEAIITKLKEECQAKDRSIEYLTTRHREVIETFEKKNQEQNQKIARTDKALKFEQKKGEGLEQSLEEQVKALNKMLFDMGSGVQLPILRDPVEKLNFFSQQLEDLKNLLETTRKNYAQTMKEAVANGVSLALAKLKASNPSVRLQAVEEDFNCLGDEAAMLLEEVMPLGNKVAEEMKIGSPSRSDHSDGPKE